MNTEQIESPASQLIEAYRREIRALKGQRIDLLNIEENVMRLLARLGAEMISEAMKLADSESAEVVIDGERWGNRRVFPGTYESLFGAIKLERSVYQQSGKGRVAVVMDYRLGIVEGYTPKMARILSRSVAVMTADEGAGFLKEVGVAQVSSATLTRIPKLMATRCELKRVAIEEAIRAQEELPCDAVTVQVGIDGVMVPQDGELAKPRGPKSEEAHRPRHEAKYGCAVPEGPAKNDATLGRAWHEASVGTVAFFDAEGKRLRTIYAARMPESSKKTTVETIEAELLSSLKECPTLNVVFASDGAAAQWTALEGIKSRLPANCTGHTMCLLDAYHAAEYVQKAANAIKGKDTPEARVLACTWRETLKECADGAQTVIRSMRGMVGRLESQRARDEVSVAIAYLAKQHASGRMNYAEAKERGYPIGTGITEAAAKTMVGTRMKRAGARFSQAGGQTVMLFRAALLSDRFEALHEQIHLDYRKDVRLAA